MKRRHLISIGMVAALLAAGETVRDLRARPLSGTRTTSIATRDNRA